MINKCMAARTSCSSSLVGLACGCGDGSQFPETIPIRGKVTYKGKPLTRGTIFFQSDRGHLASGEEIQPDRQLPPAHRGRPGRGHPGASSDLDRRPRRRPEPGAGHVAGLHAPQAAHPQEIQPTRHVGLGSGGSARTTPISRSTSNHDVSVAWISGGDRCWTSACGSPRVCAPPS